MQKRNGKDRLRWTVATVVAMGTLLALGSLSAPAASGRPDPAAQRRLEQAIQQLRQHRQQMNEELSFDRIEIECYRRQLQGSLESAREKVEVDLDMLCRAEQACAEAGGMDPELLARVCCWEQTLQTDRATIEQVRLTCQERIAGAQQRLKEDSLRWRTLIQEDERSVTQARRALRASY